MIERKVLGILAFTCLTIAAGCGSDGGGKSQAAAGSGGLMLVEPAEPESDLTCETQSYGHSCVQILDLNQAEQGSFESSCASLNGTVRRGDGSCPKAGVVASCVSPIETIPGKNRQIVYYQGYSLENAKFECESEHGVFE